MGKTLRLGEIEGKWSREGQKMRWLDSVTDQMDMNLSKLGASPVARLVKNVPAMQETWVQSPGREDPLEKEMAAHSSLLAWRIPWTAEPGGLQSTGSQRVGHDRARRHTIKRCVPRQSVTVFSSRH